MPSDLDILTDTRSDPDERRVLEDMERSRYRLSPVSRLGFALSFIHAVADAVVDAAVDVDAVVVDAVADADDVDAVVDDGVDVDVVGVGDGGVGVGDGVGDGVAGRLTKLLQEEPSMRDGLKIVQLTGAYYGWAVTRVGWLRRLSGDEWELLNARTIIRTGSPRPLGSLASHGPMEDHRLTDPDEGAEDVHRLLIRRSFAATEEAWLGHCPQPAGWQEE